MKKLEKLLEKLTNSLQDPSVIIELIGAVAWLAVECLAIGVAIVMHAYIPLAMGTYVIVRVISTYYIKKVFFKKLNKILIEFSKCTALTFFILAIVTIFIISNKYFIGVIITTIHAFVYGNFKKYKNLKEEESINLVEKNLSEQFYKKVYAYYLPWNTEGLAKYKIENVEFYAIIEGQDVVVRYPIRPYVVGSNYEKNKIVPKKYLTEANSLIEKHIPKNSFIKYFHFSEGTVNY